MFRPATGEFRASVSVEGNTLTGYAHVFGKTADVNGGKERFAPGAFDEALKRSDARATIQHDLGKLLGSQHAGTLQVSADEKGLKYSIDLPNTSYANDLKELVARGDVTEMSFGFVPGKFQFSYDKGVQVRTHTNVKDLVDISPVAIPAFAGTSLNLRAACEGETIGSQTARARQHVRSVK
jgi:uncharacterized protein